MSAATTAQVRNLTRDVPEQDEGLLNQILDRVDAIAVQQSRPSPVHLRSWAEIEAFATKAARSGMVPKDYVGKPDAICIAIQMGSELGLAPMQALQNIAVVNGRPSIWGDALPALCRASGKCAYIKEWSTGAGDDLTYHCEARRKDDPNPIVGKFSVAQAKKASLWGGAVWAKYPERMLQMRARGFGLRDAFPDVIKGLITAEEASDIPFEATGLRMPTQTTAEAINDSLPAHSGGGPDPMAAKYPALFDVPLGGQWLQNLKAACAATHAAEALAELRELSVVGTALREAPEEAREFINKALAAAGRRIQAPPATANWTQAADPDAANEPDDFPGTVTRDAAE